MQRKSRQSGQEPPVGTGEAKLDKAAFARLKRKAGGFTNSKLKTK